MNWINLKLYADSDGRITGELDVFRDRVFAFVYPPATPTHKLFLGIFIDGNSGRAAIEKYWRLWMEKRSQQQGTEPKEGTPIQ